MWFLADHCNATFGYCHEMSSVCLSSVTRVYCGQMVSWIRMPLGMQVDLGPGHIVLDGDPAPPPSKGHCPPILGPYLLRLNGWMDEDVTWYGGRPWPKWHCIRWGPSSTHPRGTAALPNFFGPCLLWPNGCMDQDASWYADRSLLGETIFSAFHTNFNLRTEVLHLWWEHIAYAECQPYFYFRCSWPTELKSVSRVSPLFRQVWSWCDHPLPSYSVLAADRLRDLLNLLSGHAWRITWSTSSKILRLSVLELWVLTLVHKT